MRIQYRREWPHFGVAETFAGLPSVFPRARLRIARARERSARNLRGGQSPFAIVSLLCVLCFDLDIDRNRLADAGDCFSRWGKYQIEVAPRDWIDRYAPARLARLVERRKYFHVKCYGLRHAVHSEAA